MDRELFAKTVVVSSLVTLCMVAGLGYISREPLAHWLHEVTVYDAKAAVADVTTSTPTHERQVMAAIEKANPAVVSIIITKEVPVYERYYESYNPFGSFGGFTIPRTRQNGTEEREVGGGSGFIVGNDGMIVTNRHVVADTDAHYSVLLNDGTSYVVEVKARDPQLDIAILQIAEPLEAPLPYLRFGDSESLALGQSVIAIGNALAEFRNSVSVGVVSGLARSIVASDQLGRSEQLDQVIQTDAAINPGNSGGPLLDIHGDVVGVNVATSQGADNIGFALPAAVVKNVVDSVREYGEIIRPFLGVRYAMVTEFIAETNNLPYPYGALVVAGESATDVAVQPGSPAAQAGIQAGAVILAIDGEELRDRDLATVLRTKTVGQTVELRVWQDGAEKTISITLDKAV